MVGSLSLSIAVSSFRSLPPGQADGIIKMWFLHLLVDSLLRDQLQHRDQCLAQAAHPDRGSSASATGTSDGKGVKLLTRTHALTCGLWQAFGAGPTDEAAKAVFADPLHLDFIDELTEALGEFWRGALSPAPE